MGFLVLATLAMSCYSSIKLTDWIFSDKAAKARNAARQGPENSRHQKPMNSFAKGFCFGCLWTILVWMMFQAEEQKSAVHAQSAAGEELCEVISPRSEQGSAIMGRSSYSIAMQDPVRAAV